MRLRLHKKLLALVLATVICLFLMIPASAATKQDAAVAPPYELSVPADNSVDAYRAHDGMSAHSRHPKSTSARSRLSRYPQSRRIVCDHQQYLQNRPPGEVCG